MKVETTVLEPRSGDTTPGDWVYPGAWWRAAATIRPQQFLLGTHYQREAFGITISAGEAGIMLALVEAMGMAIGRDLLNGNAIAPLRVLHLNAAMTQDELDRRVAAIGRHYGISQADIGGRLFVQSVCHAPARLPVMGRNGVAKIDVPAMQHLVDFICKERIDVLQLLPWVSFHAVRWNSGTDMDIMAKEGMGSIASRTQCAIGIFHEVRTVEKVTADERLAFALLSAAHSVRTLAVMSKIEAKKFGIGESDRQHCIRIDSKAKAGPAGEPVWFKLDPVVLPSDANVVCPVPWSPPGAAENLTEAQMEQFKNLIEGGLYSSDPAEHRWVGFAIARAIGIDLSPDNGRDDPQHLAKINKIIEAAGAERKRRKPTAKRGSAGVAKSRAAPKRSKPRTAA
jgi:hypothetical protein